MKTIYQRTESDCGVAALAMLADVTYEQALDFLKNNFRYTKIISSRKILAGICRFGGKPLGHQCVKIGERKLWDLDWNALLQCQLLGDKKQYGHWAVWDAEEQILRDPYGYVYPIKVERWVEISW